MEINQNENELHLYSINENEHIGSLNASVNASGGANVIVVLDNSLPAAERLVKEILPLVASKVKYWCENVRLITFGEESTFNNVRITDLSKFNLKSGGATKIGPAIEKLRLLFQNSLTCDVLIISSGEISDRENAEQETKKLTDFLAAASTNMIINSQAVRLFTTSNHRPDVKALSYLLQINNTTEPNICDVNITSANETIANEIAALILKNVPRYLYILKEPIISRFPWKPYQKKFLKMKGWNIFWLSTTEVMPLIEASSTSHNISVVDKGPLSLATFQQLVGKTLPQIVSHMKILKIVGTTEANETVDQIFSYFAKTEEALAVKCSTPNDKIITNALAGLAMFTADFRDSDEMMEFYRNSAKVIEDQIESQLRKQEEEERRKQEEEERRKQEEEERRKQEEEERRKQEEEVRRKQEEEERRKQEEEERRKQEEEERLKREEDERVRRAEEATAAHIIDPSPHSIQTVFILDEQSWDNENQRFMENIIPQRLSKLFRKSLQLVHMVTFVRYISTTSEMLQSLVQALDATKQIRISVLTNRDEHEMESLVETINKFLIGSGYVYELEAVKITLPPPKTKQYKVVDINVNESNEFIAEQIVSMSLQ